MTQEPTFSIGELSKRTGVPVKTIRYYADEGVLPPSGLRESNYRMFTQEDARKLGIVRSLRALGFSLSAISAMLEGTRAPRDLVALQLELVESQLRALERQRGVLRAATLAHDRADVVRHLDAALGAASLGAAERERRLDAWLDRTSRGAGDAGRAKIRAMVLDGLPSELSLEQLEAWIRLCALLDDEELLEALRLQHDPFAGETVTAETRETFGREVATLYARLYPLVAEGAEPTDERVGEVADAWAWVFARTLGRVDDAAFRRWLLDYARRTNDPRIEAFWRDVAVLRGSPPMPPMTRALALLADGLSHRLGEPPEA